MNVNELLDTIEDCLLYTSKCSSAVGSLGFKSGCQRLHLARYAFLISSSLAPR